MVWALRGAGIRFKNATDALKEIHDTLQKRDKNTAIGRLLTLRDEVQQNSILVNEIKNNKQRKQRDRIAQRIKTVALGSNIENPAVTTREFVHQLAEVYSDLTSEDILLDIENILNKVKTLQRLTEEELNKKGIKI